MTLAGHVDRVLRLFAAPADLRMDFENSLASAGYLQVHGPLYTQGYALGKLRVFRVEGDFPRILPASIAAGVLDVRYSLSVNSLGAFEDIAERRIGPEPEAEA